jgi:hypothetical protein
MNAELVYFSDIDAVRRRVAELDAQRERLRRAHIVALLRESAAQCQRTMRGRDIDDMFFGPGGLR